MSATTPTPETPTAGAEGAPQTPAAPAPLTAEQMSQLIRGEIARAQQETAQRQAAQPPPAPTPTEAEQAKTAKVREFAKDPDAFIAAEVKPHIDRALADTVAPVLGPVVTQTRDGLVAAHQARIDAQFGSGFFDKNIKGELFADGKGEVDRHPLAVQGNAKLIEAAVQNVLGRQLAANPELIVSSYTSRKTAEREAQEAPTSWAPSTFNPADPTSRLSPDTQAGLARMRELGVEFSEADYRMAKQAGKTLDGWVAASEAAKKKGNQ